MFEMEIVEEDKEALLDFYATTKGSFWIRNSSWGLDVSDWYGISLGVARKVIKIELPMNNLQGQLPLKSIALISNLQELSLRYK